MSGKRITEGHIIPVIGKKRSGKSYFLKHEIVEPSKKTRPILITDWEGAEDKWHEYKFLDVANPKHYIGWKKGVCKCTVTYIQQEYESSPIKYINKYFRNGILILDDAKTFNNDKVSKDLERLLIRSRQWGIDLYFVAHSFQDVPIVIFKHMSAIILFKTNVLIDKGRHDFLETYDLLSRMNKTVNASKDKHYSEIEFFM